MDRKGIHLIGDLYGCDLSQFILTAAALEPLRQTISGIIAEERLVELGNYYHFFGPNAVTATICLAESHLNFHTWPEDNYVSLDLYVCNRARYHEAAAEKIFNYFTNKLFRPKEAKTQRLVR